MIAWLNETVIAVNDILYGYLLVYVLVAAGLFLTIYLGFPQFKHFPAIIRSLSGSRDGEKHEVSSFQAFAVGVGTRVGIGNIGGVALALILGGPGAIFWMWVVALLGMTTAFCESTLAQLFKVKNRDGSFRGGPSYYMTRGLSARWMGIIFAAITVLASGIAVPMVQVNAVAATLDANHGVPKWGTALIMMLLLAPVIIGGLRSVARAAEYLAPIMAFVYLALTIVVIFMNLPAAGSAIMEIFRGALGLQSGIAGVTGGIFAALLNGARRGLFSNEAGLGTAPNVAGSAAASHPVKQGWVQALGVFIDTILICTATAILILTSAPSVFVGGLETNAAGTLTGDALIFHYGSWALPVVSLIIFIFAYTSAFGAYSYGQVALDFLTQNRAVSFVYRVVVILACGWASVQALSLVWAISDVLLGLGALFNLYAVIRLAPWVKALLADWRENPAADFHAENNAHLPAPIKDHAWA
ncbi:alanine/glycine:cation symporter family protein [Boudabousia marimammalium]|uniref:Sodium:alanine symporter family protein n=1 Tax=Boudabousia marimammalium TaxID=156892 RepID=A0A1Q5PPN7_9ACTO|nr:alanine/glycine:cation symporter family protein [Boudabousia marimammalium]OKL49365.1 sodium:alanine symporter family protein [Boudabousia marimammalium]